MSISDSEMRTLALATAGVIIHWQSRFERYSPSPSPNDPRAALNVRIPPQPARISCTSESGEMVELRPPIISAEKESVTATCPQRAGGVADIGMGRVQTSCPAIAE
eukprot:scaffold15277_cov129-Isochrysis_galbana.AAC.2